MDDRLNGLLNDAEFSIRCKKRLAIIVPFRNRPRQLVACAQCIMNYFQRDKLDRNVSVSIPVVEQPGAALFNAGKVRNCGFKIAAESCDYVCFHDVDYLPIWTGYSWSPRRPHA